MKIKNMGKEIIEYLNIINKLIKSILGLDSFVYEEKLIKVNLSTRFKLEIKVKDILFNSSSKEVEISYIDTESPKDWKWGENTLWSPYCTDIDSIGNKNLLDKIVKVISEINKEISYDSYRRSTQSY